MEVEQAGRADEGLEREENAEAINEAMATLSPADREIILLRSLEDLSVSEVSSMLEISADAVRQRHSRAVRRLGDAYRELAPEEGSSS